MTHLSLTLLLIAGAAPVPQTPAPSYSKQIKPFFARYCVECHNAKDAEGSLNLQTYRSLMQGGERGAAIVAGKPDTSRLVRLIEGKQKPAMPPRKSAQPKADEVALVRAWVRAGARDDGAAGQVTLPKIVAKRKTNPPVKALAYAPDGKLYAARGNNVFILDERGQKFGEGHDRSDGISALGISSKSVLAVASGTTGVKGQASLWDLEAGRLLHPDALEHNDVTSGRCQVQGHGCAGRTATDDGDLGLELAFHDRMNASP